MAGTGVKTTLFLGIRLIDGTGAAPIEDAALLVEGAIITRCGRRGDVAACPGTLVVDLAGNTVMPGLINCHAHMVLDPSPDSIALLQGAPDARLALRAAANLGRQLRSGVTWLRDAGCVRSIDVEMKRCLRDGLVVGPDLMVSGRVITMTGGHFAMGGRECDGADEVRKGVREQIKIGVDLVKLMATGGVMTPGSEPGAPQLTPEELAAGVEEAHKAGRRVAAHAQGSTGIKNAVRAGVDSIEHGVHLDDEAVELMLERGAFLVPTLSAPSNIIEHGVVGGVPPYAVEKTLRGHEAHMRGFQKARAAGVRIAMGTDSGTPFNPHDRIGRELALMVEWGMTPMEAIVASTKTAAELLGVAERCGTLEPGKAADFLVLKDDPLRSIQTLLDITTVYKAGKAID